VVFTMGGTAVPGVSVSAILQQSAMDLTVQNSLKNAVMPSVQDAMLSTSTTIENAFAVGITAGATQQLFTKLCNAPLAAFKADGVTPNDPTLVGKTPGQIFKIKATAALVGKTKNKSVGVGCASDVNVATK